MTTTRRLTRMPYKQSAERPDLDKLLDESIWGQVAFVDDLGHPQIVPVAVARHRDELIWHGSTGSTWLRLISGAREVAVSVSSIEALVVGRSRLESSFWYRSAVIYGQPRRLEDGELDHALNVLTDHVLPGRVTETRSSSKSELAATLVLALPISDWILKESYEWPDDRKPTAKPTCGREPSRFARCTPSPSQPPTCVGPSRFRSHVGALPDRIGERSGPGQ